MKEFTSILLIIITAKIFAQRPYPLEMPEQTLIFANATLHIGDGNKIDNGTMVVEKGKILFAGHTQDFSANQFPDAKIINLEGKHIYPGFILLNTTAGLREIDAVKATLDYNEIGTFNPNARALIAYNTDSKIIPTLRSNGILMLQSTPKGGAISGTSSVFAADGWNWEDALIKQDDGIHFVWPVKYQPQGWWAEQAGYKPNKFKDSLINEFSKILDDAKFYSTQIIPRLDLRLEALKGLFNGSQNLYLQVSNAFEIIEAVTFFKQKGIPKIILKTNYEATKVKDFLKENNIPVILERLFRLPVAIDDDIMAYYNAPGILMEAGILTALDFSGDMEAMNGRNLPFAAGASVGFGLNAEMALKMITLNAAEILGLEKRIGSLEPGKDATFFVSKGNALEIIGNNLTDAYIRGVPIILENHQTELYKTYLKKFNLN